MLQCDEICGSLNVVELSKIFNNFLSPLGRVSVNEWGQGQGSIHVNVWMQTRCRWGFNFITHRYFWKTKLN